MKQQKIKLTAFLSILVALSIGDFPVILNSQSKIPSSLVLAQTAVDRTAPPPNPIPANREAEPERPLNQEIDRSPNSQSQKAERLFNQGVQQLQTSQSQAALQSWEQALIIYREIKDRQGEGATLGNLGLAYLNLGDYTKAINYTQHWLAIALDIKDRQSEGKALINLGIAYRNLGNYAKAIEYQQQQLAIARELKDRQSEGISLINLGIAYDFLGNYAKAIEYQEQSLAIAREIKDRKSEGIALGNLGNTYLSLADYTKVISYTQQWLAIAREIKDRKSEGIGLGNLGEAYLNLGDYAKAIDYTQQWLAIARDIKDRQNEAIALSNLGLTLYKQGNFPAAEIALVDSIKISESLRAGLDDTNKVSIFETQTNPYLILQKVLVTQNKTSSALEIAERGRARAFVELLASRLDSSDSVKNTFDPPNIQQIQQIAKEQNATIVEYSTIGNQAIYIWVIEPKGKITFRSVDLKSLNTNLRSVAENTRVAVATNRGLSASDSVLADFVSNTRDAVGAPETKTSDRQENATLKTSQRCHKNQCVQLMYKLLIEPIADLLPTNPNSHVIFIPHQSLFLVPFAALQDPDGKYLIEKHTIQTAPAIQVLHFTHQQRQKLRQAAPPNLLVVGNPTMPKVGFPPQQLLSLPGAEKEAIAIAKILKTKAILGAQATKTSIVKQLPKARIIHLATHGLLNEVTRRGLPGSIALAPDSQTSPLQGEGGDGLLSSSEIIDLKLNAELVVLSACNTGRGKVTGDGVIGLSRALVSAGVSSVLVSLWSVPDAPTGELMIEFYRQLQQNPNKAQALRQAMLIAMKKYPNPQDWAAFTLIGEAD
jgi:CHAT domain-containing protein